MVSRWKLVYQNERDFFFPKKSGQFLVRIYDIFYKYFKSETLKAKNMRTLDLLVNPFSKKLISSHN